MLIWSHCCQVIFRDSWSWTIILKAIPGNTGLIFILHPIKFSFYCSSISMLTWNTTAFAASHWNMMHFGIVLMLLTSKWWDFLTPQTDTGSLRWANRGTYSYLKKKNQARWVRTAWRRTGLKLNFKWLISSILVHLTQSYRWTATQGPVKIQNSS